MSTRSIVTSQPDVACDVCARRLLRGEQPDTFIAAGRRLTVCELCAPRATHEGWKRETDQPDLALAPMRPRRGRGLLYRLRGMAPSQGLEADTQARREPLQTPEQSPADDRPFDMFAASPEASEASSEAEREPAPAPGSPYLGQALEVFNSSEFPRRIAGVARSLGEPIVHVRSAEHLESVVEIVIAWELCWYRYGVDLSVEQPVAEAGGQGTELEELDRDQRTANASATAAGMLALAQ